MEAIKKKFLELLLLMTCISLFILTDSNYCWSNNAIINKNSDRIKVNDNQSYQFEKDIDSIIVIYWNAWGNNYYEYTFSYSLMTGEILVYVDYKESCPKYCIDSSEQIDLFISSINDFYLNKTTPIIEKKKKYDTDEHSEYDIPTFHVECYKKEKLVLSSFTPLENGDYELVFNPKFIKFKNMVLSMVKKYDEYVENYGNTWESNK